MEEKNKFISVEDAATILGVSDRHIKNMIRAGKLRAKNVSTSTVGRVYWRVVREDVERIDNEKSSEKPLVEGGEE